MKKLFLLNLLFFSFHVFSQHADIFQEWYIQSITINNVTTEIPQDPIEFPYASMTFFDTSSGFVVSHNTEPNGYYPINCEIGFGGHLNYTNDNFFNFLDFNPISNTGDCSNNSLINFMTAYLDFYNNGINDQFNYSITNEIDNSKTLTISNSLGNTVVYSNTFFVFAPQEINNLTWYLQNVIINGNTNTPPNNEDSVVPTLFFDDDYFYTSICSSLTNRVSFQYDLTQFYLYEMGTDYNLTLCNIDVPINNDYTDLYIRDFFLSNLPGPFIYNYTVNSNEETLIITAPNGNQAIYKKTALATNENNLQNQLSIYPNPVKNTLTLELPNTTIKEIKIYTVLGKEIVKTTDKKIDMSSFSNGIYIVKITSNENNIITKKFVKVGL